MPAFRRSALAAAAASLCLASSLSPAATPLGGEFLVNTTTARNQLLPAVAMDADGDFIVVWTHTFSDAGDTDIYAQRYSASGARRGLEQLIASTGAAESNPDVAMDPDGNYVVSWTLANEIGTKGVRARRYNADGLPLDAAPLVVNSYITGDQDHSAVAMDAAGNFVVAWDSTGQSASGTLIRARLYDAAGTARGDEFAGVASPGTTPAVAMDPTGAFAVAYTFSGDGSGTSIGASFFDAAGVARGTLPQVNAVAAGDQAEPSIAVDGGGNFVIAWSTARVPQGARGFISARRFNAERMALGGDIALDNQPPEFADLSPVVRVDAQGRFVVAWVYSSFTTSIRARRFDAQGTAVEDGVQVDAPGFGQFPKGPALGVDADGDYVIAWQRQVSNGGNSNADGSGDGISARRYRGDESIDLSLSQSDAADPAPIGSPLRYTLSVSNLHPLVPASGIDAIDRAIGASRTVRVRDLLPEGASAADFSGNNWTCSNPQGRLVCDYSAPLNAGAVSSPLTVTLTPPEEPGELITNVAAVSAINPDPELLNNRDAESTRLACPDSVIQFSAATFTVGEQTANATVTATRTGGSCGVVTVQYDTAASSALPGLDFTDVSGTLTWADGNVANKTFTVPITNDGLDENNERILLSLGPVSGGVIGAQRNARIAITDDDASPRINFTSVAQSVAESPALVTVVARLAAESGRDVTVPLTYGGTAGNGSDYFPGAGVITIRAGQVQSSVDLEIAGDTSDEPDETVIVGMGAVSGAIVGSLNSQTVTILDDDEAVALPTVSFSAASSSGDEATTRSAVVTLSAASAQSVTVPFVISGSATQGADYTLNRTTPITFNPGVTQIGIQIAPVDDAANEPNETVILTLGTPTGATLGAGTVHTRTIIDNDP